MLVRRVSVSPVQPVQGGGEEVKLEGIHLRPENTLLTTRDPGLYDLVVPVIVDVVCIMMSIFRPDCSDWRYSITATDCICRRLRH